MIGTFQKNKKSIVWGEIRGGSGSVSRDAPPVSPQTIDFLVFLVRTNPFLFFFCFLWFFWYVLHFLLKSVIFFGTYCIFCSKMASLLHFVAIDAIFFCTYCTFCSKVASLLHFVAIESPKRCSVATFGIKNADTTAFWAFDSHEVP